VATAAAARDQCGFAREFATADGRRVMVAALTWQQFTDLANHRDTIAVLLAPWFARRTIAELAAAFAGTSVPWARLHNLTSRPGSRH
jgi:2-methylfumaryl-CoA isomerase